MQIRRSVSFALAAAGVLVTASIATAPQASADEISVRYCGQSGTNLATVTGEQAITRAQSWLPPVVARRVNYNQSLCWRNQYGRYREDCSGYVSMAWGLPSSLVAHNLDPRFADTAYLRSQLQQVPPTALRPGDALNFNVSSPWEKSHIVLFGGWAPNDAGQHRYFVYYSESNPRVGTVKGTGDLQSSYWRKYIGVRYKKMTWSAPQPSVPAMSAALISGYGDFTGDGKSDIVGYNPTRSGGAITVYPGTGTGSTTTASTWGGGWSQFNALLRADYNRDGKQDLIARSKTDGTLKFYKGTNAIPNAAVTIPNTSGWNQFTQLAAPGDLTGDGQPDILGATPGGDLYLYTVTSTPGATPTITGKARIAAGWNRFKEIVTTGDLTRDGKPDVLAIDRNTGDLLLYAGTGQSTLAYTTTIATGWHGFNNVTGLADFNKDGYPDLAAV